MLTSPIPDEPVEPSDLYMELIGCLMYKMTCTRPELAYPLGFLARFVANGSAKAEIYASAVAAQELRWLIYLLADIGERPSFAPTWFADWEGRLKHIDLRYFVLRELQQYSSARLAFVASAVNTADIYTKALSPGGCCCSNGCRCCRGGCCAGRPMPAAPPELVPHVIAPSKPTPQATTPPESTATSHDGDNDFGRDKDCVGNCEDDAGDGRDCGNGCGEGRGREGRNE
ncbi:unnamed protein product [Closterium sp. NIES-53]